MKKWFPALILAALFLAGCSRYKPVKELPEDSASSSEPAITVEESSPAVESISETRAQEEIIRITNGDSPVYDRKPVKVRGIYISAYMAGSGEGMDKILDRVDQTEINTVVIDVKDDEGRITFPMEEAPTVEEIGAVKPYIRDIDELITDLKSRGIYVIARVVAFRDPYLAEQKPDWSLKNADGSIHRDNKDKAWINPYRQEVWDYLVEVGGAAARAGFDEVQFDYIRFSTDATMKDVVIGEEDTKGRSRTDIITEFISYAYDRLAPQGIFVSADVFGAIIGSQADQDSVGQIYSEMAKHLDYICPMIYPSHYGDGNFGIEHPDTEPYKTILAALQGSREDLNKSGAGAERQAVVRPWLQDFTASYLPVYISYGPDQVRQQIQAVYDAGYDEWLLWDAANTYTWDGLLTPQQAEEEWSRVEESRAAAAEQKEAEPDTQESPAPAP